MPVLSDAEKGLVMEAIIALRGKTTKKQQDAFKNGNLWVKRGPLRYSRLNDPVEDLVGKLNPRTNASAADVLDQIKMSPKLLKVIRCPSCQNPKSTKNLKLESKSQYANLLCEICCNVSFANTWSCECGLRWQKCGSHEIHLNDPPTSQPKRKRREDQRGCDEPMPKFRRQTQHGCKSRVPAQAPAATERIRVALNPHSKLAQRFPHHVKRVATDQRVAPG